MFGYIKPFIPELKVREYELYRAVYCGLCKSMGKTTKLLSRLSLSYDAVFLALVLSSLSGKEFETYKGRCGLNPFKKMLIAKDCDILRYSSAASAQLTYYSLLDRVRDERGFKRLLAKLCLPAFGKIKNKAKAVYDFDDEKTEKLLDELHSAEDEQTQSLDLASDIFGRLLSYYFGSGAPEDKKESAAAIGRMTGRFIYAADACDDLEKDIKKDAYNPLKSGEGDKALRLHGAFGAMCIWADSAAGELALEGKSGYSADIADNIMRLGMVDTAKNVTDPGKKGRKRRK